jgi:hypothetical protein
MVLPHVEVVVDPGRRDGFDGPPGELCSRGHLVMAGY